MDLREIIKAGNFDLHLHTTASDGQYPPDELVKKAQKIGLKTIAITDHDTLSGLEEAEKAGEKYGIQVIRGIEMSSKYHGKTVDILGFNIESSSELKEILTEMVRKRESRAIQIIQKFGELGMPLKLEDVMKYSQGSVIARPHIAKAIVEKGYISNEQSVFDQYLADGKPCSVEKMIITPQDAIDFIHQAGGVAVLAHPVVLGDDKLVAELLQNHNFDGIEVWHRKQSKADNECYKILALHFNLIMTGGSDFHHDEHQLGVFGFH